MAESISTTQQFYIDTVEAERASSLSNFTLYPVRRLSDTFTRVRRSTVTPGFRALKKRGGLLPNNSYYHGEIRTPANTYIPGSRKSYRTEVVNGKSVTFLSGYMDGMIGEWGIQATDTLSRLEAIADAIAINNLRNKAKDMKVNAAQAYAESAQVSRLIGDSAMKIGEVLHYIRKGNLIAAGAALGIRVSRRKHSKHKKAVSQVKTNEDIDRVLSNGVLQVQYGIRPLLSDIIGAAQLLAQKNSRELLAYVSSSNSQSQTKKTVMKSASSFSDITSTLDHEFSVVIRYGIRFSTPSQVFHTMKQLGLTNPPLIAWELLPWSFVIDWFIPIGNYLQSLDATLGLQFETGYKSVVRRDAYTRSVVLSARNNKNFDVGSGSLTGSSRVFERSVLTNWPLSKLPSFKNPLSFEHALNGIALLSQFRKNVYFRVK